MAAEKADKYIKGSEPEDASAYAANYGAHVAGTTKEDMAKYYSKWATDGGYEKDLCPGRYNGPSITANAIASVIPTEERGNVQIMDVAAGTGFLGEELVKLGFKNIDCLDPAEGMLETARKKNIYNRFVCDFISDEKIDVIEAGFYDVSAIAGGMGEGHVPCSALHELIRITKKGGFVCVVMREEYLAHVAEYKNRLEPLMAQLEDEGKWERIGRDVVPRYSFDNNGVVFKYRIL